MAKHKAATEISIAQEERSAFAEFVDQYKWVGLGALGAVAAGILWMSRSNEAAVKENRGDWGVLYSALSGADPQAATVADAAMAIKKPDVAAIARISQASILARDGEYSDADTALGFALDNAPAVFSKTKFPIGKDGAEMTLLKKMQTSVSAEGKWADAHKQLFENPAPPEGSPRVELNTSEGKIVIALYMEKAPAHAKNFIKLASEGYYDGTRFHRIQTGGFIQGGDPNTRDGEPATWGTGGPDTKVPQEDSGLVHGAGVLAAAKVGGDKDSSGSQFYITASPQYQFDGNYVVYGAVVEGLEFVEGISNAEVTEDNAERPTEPVTITSATVIN